MSAELSKIAAQMRALALEYPETYEEQPWGDRVVKVKGKIFFFCGVHGKLLYTTVKLPKSGRKVLERKDAEPTHYGMGKHGWVTLKFAAAKQVPVGELKQWMHESFLAVAPKTIVKQLESAAAPPGKTRAARSATKSATKSAAPAASKPARAKKARGTAILVCDDALRSQRAVDALAARGITCAVVPSLTLKQLGKARALIVDLGRNPQEGLELARALDESDRAVHLFVAGVRDGAQARKLRELGSAETFRAPPGDSEVVDAVAAAFTK